MERAPSLLPPFEARLRRAPQGDGGDCCGLLNPEQRARPLDYFVALLLAMTRGRRRSLRYCFAAVEALRRAGLD
jgi:hypothetical protein